MRFRDRVEAGQQLAELLKPFRDENPLVLALPRGGVPIGYEVARALAAPLDVIVVRKLGAPSQPELGLGAIAEGGALWVDSWLLRELQISSEQLELIARSETAELERRVSMYRGGRPLPAIEGRTVIVVDDGVATGGTVRAALRALREHRPLRVVLAVPVIAAETALVLRREVDDLICVYAPEEFYAVGAWYDEFSQTTDDEVKSLLDAAREASLQGKPAPVAPSLPPADPDEVAIPCDANP